MSLAIFHVDDRRRVLMVGGRFSWCVIFCRWNGINLYSLKSRNEIIHPCLFSRPVLSVELVILDDLCSC